MRNEAFYAPMEVKFSHDEGTPGSFEGYGAIFGNIDAYGDVIQKGAFRETLRDWRSQKRLPPMLIQHGGFGFGDMDGLAIGKWTSMEEDDTGLKVSGKLIGLDTERGKTIYSAMKEGVLDGMSIGYRAKEFTLGTKPDEPRRTLKKVDLVELSVVQMPANGKARVASVKAAAEDITGAIRWLRKAIVLHEAHMDGSIKPTPASQQKMMDQMKNAYDLLTEAKPAGAMSASSSIKTIREFEDFLRDAGFSNAQAKAIASSGYKAADPRDEGEAGIAALLRRNIASLSY